MDENIQYEHRKLAGELGIVDEETLQGVLDDLQDPLAVIQGITLTPYEGEE